ncbi:ABC transporter ATP-binding protein [Paenibacillus sp. 481]|uniref:ABC transporter ATP-binding protein n=1 Tax=Paenibacillus sp. 481 TaxID=2835869 RepID=UPI001E289FBA|nr:ABC transporter ATP-binding protein [Paenibacillus sp. 481]UHA74811.1 ATP-binding cassette domain-containing protein [Paenibacillus sp. 481]
MKQAWDGGSMKQLGLGKGDSSKHARVKLKDVSLRRIGELFRGYWSRLSFIIGLALAAAVIGLLPPLVMQRIIDVAIPQGDMQQMLKWAACLVGLPIVSGALGVWQSHLNTQVTQSVMADVRQGLFRNLQRQSVGFFTASRSGEVIQRLTDDVAAIQNVVTNVIVSSLSQLVIVVTTITILFVLDWKLALISIVILPVAMIPVRKVATVRKQMRTETQKVRADMASQLGEVFGVSGAMLTRIFGREASQEAEFAQQNRRVQELEVRLNLIGRWFFMFITTLGPLGTAVIYLYGGYAVIQGQMTIGAIVAFAAYLTRLYQPFGTLLNLHVEVMTALGVFKRIFDYMDMEPDVQDKPRALQLEAVAGAIEFDRVAFAYSNSEPNGRKADGSDADGSRSLSGTPNDSDSNGTNSSDTNSNGTNSNDTNSDGTDFNGSDSSSEAGLRVLHNVSFKAKPGEVIALVGPSGAGKSTLINLIGRMYDVTDGTVKVDDTDVREVTMASLRAQVAYVTQESFLFHATVADNLRFAKADATQAELEEACRQAYLHDMIMSLPLGYATMVGERGHRLSGGERQRLAIARAILKDPRILILDEATSHLDSQSEAYVQAALTALMQGRTTVVIAHRLSTILTADQILVLQKGTIVERGRHSELLAQGGLYATLYETQFEQKSALFF